MKILDCTFRDGGYYTNWDFASNIVDAYIQAVNSLPIDYIEVGYRNKPSSDYIGKFGYTPVSVLRHIRENCTKKIVVMLNEKNTLPGDLDTLLKPIVGFADMVRLAIDPKNFDRAVVLARAVKELGFEVGFNVMYMSKWSEMGDFLSKLRVLDDFCDLFCMVDSFGGVTPDEVADIYKIVKANTSVPIGFHGHNNLQLGLINSITAMNLGVDYVDATVLGMGRGAGNLNMELLLTFLNKHKGFDVDFNILGDVITAFTPLMDKYKWGTNLPYMIAGANKIPQKEVMDWVTNRVYSFNSIVRALDNRKNQAIDNAKYPVLDSTRKFDIVLVIGGGNSAIEHIDAIKEYTRLHRNIAFVFATARHAAKYLDLSVPKYYCLIGSESRRLSMNVDSDTFDDVCVLPPYPRVMGTEVPPFANDKTFELSEVVLSTDYKDSVTTIALQLAKQLSVGKIYMVGYDGYAGNVLSDKEASLTNENKSIFSSFLDFYGEKLKSLTPTIYKELHVESVYQFI